MMDCATYTGETPAMPDEATWNALYYGLQRFVTTLVQNFPVPAWKGQESDVVADIVQESIRKVFERLQKAQQGYAEPIQSLKQMSATIAYNTYRDFRRRDRRLCHITDPQTKVTVQGVDKAEHPLEYVSEQLYQEYIFAHIAQDIVTFPPKQQRALLTDLANRMYFNNGITPLQSALQQAGIAIQTYQRTLPEDKTERYRYASILNHAYKRVRTIAQRKGYI